MTDEATPRGHSCRMHEARRVRDLIRTRLLDCDFRDGRLPDEIHLMVEYGAGRNIIRAALALLQHEGLICRTQGVGTFSLTRKTRLALRDATGLAASVDNPTRIVTRVLSVKEAAAPADVARQLDTEPGSTCLVVDVVTMLDGRPALVLTSYIADVDARRRVGRALGAQSWLGDWYDLLANVDLRPTRRETMTEAVLVDEAVSPLLDLPVGEPAMRVERRMALGEDAITEFGYAYSRGDLIVFVMNDSVLTAGAVR